MAFLDQFNDDLLTAKAKANCPRVKRWIGARGGSSRRRYVCYVCGETVATECAKYPPTKTASKAIENHMNQHKLTGE